MDFRTLPPGYVLGDRFVVEGRLGDGAMGTVYLVRSTSNPGAALALKAGAGMDRPRRARLQVEYQTLARLSHPGLVHAYAWGEERSARCVFYVMEHVEGAPLLTRISSSWLSLRETLGLYRRVVEATAYLHSQGVTHRDLKSSNILVRPNGSVVLVDLGICRAPERGEAAAHGDLSGTLLITSPEGAAALLGGNPSSDVTGPRADVYALGVLLYHLLTAQWPHHLPGKTPAGQVDYLRHVRDLPPVLPREAHPDAPPHLSALALDMLAPAARRPASASELLAPLDMAILGDDARLDTPCALVDEDLQPRAAEDSFARADRAATPALPADPHLQRPATRPVPN